MGLAPYGNPNSKETLRFIDIIKNLVDIKDDGSIWLNQKYYEYSTGLRMVNDYKWKALFFKKRWKWRYKSEDNLALAIQIVTEEIVIKMAEYAKELITS